MSEIQMTAAQPAANKGWQGTVLLQTFCHLLIPGALFLFLWSAVLPALPVYQLQGTPISGLGQAVLSLTSWLVAFWYLGALLTIALLAADAFVLRLLLLSKGLQQNRYWFFGVLAAQGLLLIVTWMAIPH